jgi:hypothetical protein
MYETVSPSLLFFLVPIPHNRLFLSQGARVWLPDKALVWVGATVDTLDEDAHQLTLTDETGKVRLALLYSASFPMYSAATGTLSPRYR